MDNAKERNWGQAKGVRNKGQWDNKKKKNPIRSCTGEGSQTKCHPEEQIHGKLKWEKSCKKRGRQRVNGGWG